MDIIEKLIKQALIKEIDKAKSKDPNTILTVSFEIKASTLLKLFEEM